MAGHESLTPQSGEVWARKWGDYLIVCSDMHLVGASWVADIAETLLECRLRQRYGSWQRAPRSERYGHISR